MRTFIKTLSLSAALALPLGLALADGPNTKISAAKHPNLASAQTLVAQASEKLADAQNANEYDTEGHAQKARELLQRANDEIKLAAIAADKNAKQVRDARDKQR